MTTLFDMTGHTDDLTEAIEQWQTEREAMAELFDENQAYELLYRRYIVTLDLAEKVVAIVEADSALFLSDKARSAIEKFREQNESIEKSKAFLQYLHYQHHKSKKE